MARMRSLPPLARAATLGAMHLLVDAACVMAVFRTGESTLVRLMSSFAVVFGYDLLAFATQAPIGILVDRRGLSRASIFAGLGLAALALLLAPYATLATMLAAGFGNSLFHLGAGARVLRSCGAATAPAGLFVAPGALGLGLGMWMGKTAIGPSWPLVALLVLALPLVDVAIAEKRAEVPEESAGAHLSPTIGGLALALLFASTMIRSYVGFGACHECERGTVLLLVGIPLAGFLGKSMGGLIADRLGWTETSIVGLLLSAPLIAFNGGSALIALAGLVLFQMTMPVTLAATSRVLPGRPATAFGIPSLALILGAIPTFFSQGQLYSSGIFIGLILVSAASLLAALRLLGVSRSSGSPSPLLAIGKGRMA